MNEELGEKQIWPISSDSTIYGYNNNMVYIHIKSFHHFTLPRYRNCLATVVSTYTCVWVHVRVRYVSHSVHFV